MGKQYNFAYHPSLDNTYNKTATGKSLYYSDGMAKVHVYFDENDSVDRIASSINFRGSK